MLRFLKQLDLNCTLRFSFTDTMFNISSTRCLPKGHLTPSEAQVGVQISWQPHRCSQQCNTNAKFRTTSCKRSASQRDLISIQQVLLSCIADSRAHCLPVELSGCNQNGLTQQEITIYREWLTISVVHSRADLHLYSRLMGQNKHSKWACTAQWWLAMAARQEFNSIGFQALVPSANLPCEGHAGHLETDR